MAQLSNTQSRWKEHENPIDSQPRVERAALRRRMPMPDDDDDDDEEEEEEGNSTFARLEAYTEAVRSEVLIVHALLDDQPDQVIIFKGFSSSLVRRTSPDPSKPVLPSRAIIKSIDRIRGPFNPSNINYIQKDLKWEEFEELLKEKQL
ncbi:hypothetical protein SUGI_1153560 [Cryptomeria japonica]|nr:hypothetical protein SUGI_1153560 [Cryptomeria japonica]